jgi:hypothetical protein
MVTPTEIKKNKPPIKQLKYKTPELLEAAIETYFKSEPERPTTAGLAVALGFCDRQSLYAYKNRDEAYCCVIKRAISRIETYHEASLSNQACAGHIFWLKNHNWRDKQDVEQSGEITLKVVYD